MKASQLRARYWRIVFFFGGVTLGFIFWEIFLPRIGLRSWARAHALGAQPHAPRCASGRSPSAWAG